MFLISSILFITEYLYPLRFSIAVRISCGKSSASCAWGNRGCCWGSSRTIDVAVLSGDLSLLITLLLVPNLRTKIFATGKVMRRILKNASTSLILRSLTVNTLSPTCKWPCAGDLRWTLVTIKLKMMVCN